MLASIFGEWEKFSGDEWALPGLKLFTGLDEHDGLMELSWAASQVLQLCSFVAFEVSGE